MSKEGALEKSGANVPAYLQKDKGAGMEKVTKEDLILPRLKLLQPLSPEVQEEDSEAKAGQMVNSIDAKLNYGSELTFTPILFFKSRIRWTPRGDDAPPDAPKGMECTSTDSLTARDAKGLTKAGEPTADCSVCVHQAFSADGKPPRCSLYMNFASLIDGQPIVVSMEKTKLPAAKNLLTMASMLKGGGLALFAGRYKLSTKKIKNDKGTYYIFVVEAAGITSEEDYSKAKAAYEGLKGSIIVVDQDRETDAPSGDGDGDKGDF